MSEAERVSFLKEQDAIARMHPLGRTGAMTCVPAEVCNLLPHMCGMAEISELLCNVLVKPSIAKKVYMETAGRLTGFHFALVGENGTGRRSAMRSVCAACCIDALTITYHQYVYGDIGYAIRYASSHMPCVVYFDDFDSLGCKDEFAAEFSYQVLGQDRLCNTWEGVWLGFGVQTQAAATAWPLADLCGPRFASVRNLTDEEAARLLMQDFLSTGGAQVDVESMTGQQWTVLAAAMQDCTPQDLKGFAGSVLWSALSRVSTGSHATANDIPVLGPTSRWTRGAAQQRQHRPPVEVKWTMDAEPCYKKQGTEETGTGVRKAVVLKRGFSAQKFGRR